MHRFLVVLLALGLADSGLAQSLRFQDRTALAGLAAPGLGRGVAVTDYDNDGDDDIFVAMQYGPSRLFANDGHGVFADVTTASGISMNGRYSAPVWADFDNDGHRDLLVGGYDNPPRLWRNLGDGRFEAVEAGSGFPADVDVGSVAIADYDGDGLVDVFLAVDRAADLLFRNRGGFVFQDVSAAALVAGLPFSVAMQASWMDYDHDGDPDLFAVLDGEGRVLDGSVNSLAANRLHRNGGYLPLLDQADYAGIRDPGAGNSMGIAWADYDGDGWEDLYVSRKDYAGLYRNLGNGKFETVASAAGAERNGMAWGTVFGDFDNDGDADLYAVNAFGYYRMPSIMYENRGGQFFDVSQASGTDMRQESIGLASADFDGDGQLDLVFSAYDGQLHLLAGDVPNPGNFVRVRLTGIQSNRMAIGARVELRAGGRTWSQPLLGGDSYCSQSSAVLHFGIGTFDFVDEVRVYWGGDYLDIVHDVAAGTTLDVTQTGALQTATEVPDVPTDRALLEGVHPNPTGGSVSVSYRTLPGEAARFEVVDVLGRTAMTTFGQPANRSSRVAFSTENLPPGVYWIRMRSGRTISSRPVVVAR